jgi:chloramphenicol O-acetyltransferase type A
LKKIDLKNWSRRQHYYHFIALKDPYFALTVPLDVNVAYKKSKDHNISFFAVYLHACMMAINQTENFKYRIINDEIFELDVIHASATILRQDHTFGFSYINFSENFEEFNLNIIREKQRVHESSELYPPKYGLDCIHCSALPWFSFSSQKEPFSGLQDYIPKIAFSKSYQHGDRLLMNVSISVNHALVDGYHVSLFSQKFQDFLNVK